MLASIQRLLDAAAVARSEGRLADARQQLQAAVAELRRGEQALDLARALRGLARIERALHNDAGAISLYAEAADLCRGSGDAQALGSALRHLGEIHLQAGRLDQAAHPIEEAVALYRATPGIDTLELANALRPLALLRGAQGAPQSAAELWREARSLYLAVGVVEGVAECDAWLTAPGGTSAE